MLPVEGGGGGGWKREEELRRGCWWDCEVVGASEYIVVLASRKALARRGRGIVRGFVDFVDGGMGEDDVGAEGVGWREVDVVEGIVRGGKDFATFFFLFFSSGDGNGLLLSVWAPELYNDARVATEMLSLSLFFFSQSTNNDIKQPRQDSRLSTDKIQ